MINNYDKSEQEMEKHTVVLFRMKRAIVDGYSLHKVARLVRRFLGLPEQLLLPWVVIIIIAQVWSPKPFYSAPGYNESITVMDESYKIAGRSPYI